MRSNRDYLLTVETPDFEKAIEISPPFRVAFSVDKSIYGGLNKAQVKIYNLGLDKRQAMAKDAEDGSRNIRVNLAVGYQGRLERVFSGRVHIGMSGREDTDIVTTLESLDGLQAVYGFSSLTVDGEDVIAAIIGDVEGLSAGKISDLPKPLRPKVLLGNTIDLINEQVGRINKQWFIDNDQLNVVADEEVTGDYIPVVSPETGLLSTPTKENQMITFTTLMNPTVKIGALAELRSRIAPYFNGIYRCETINYSGDNYGNDWSQSVTGRLAANYTVLNG